jgi:hypothetical protein
MSALSSVLRRKPAQATVRTHTKDLLPINVKLGRSKFEYTWSDGKGSWKSKSSGAKEDEKHIAALQREIDKLREQLDSLEKQRMKEVETRFMVEFKNKLLLEMLAVAQLDADKNKANLKIEKIKAEALKFELASLSVSMEDIERN